MQKVLIEYIIEMEIFQLRPDDAENLGNWCFDITT
jgi:hypothetical protein